MENGYVELNSRMTVGDNDSVWNYTDELEEKY